MKIWRSESALPLSVYKPYHKLALEYRSHLVYNSIFRKESGKDKAWRLYYDLTKTKHSLTIVPPQVEHQLEEHKIILEDYLRGLGTDKHGRTVKIGKFLTGVAKRMFENDPKRAIHKKDGNLLVVISRHPYDVIGSSSGRSWTSCLNMSGGVNRRFIAEDVKHGTLVAYLVVNTDKNINHPISRMRIIRYFDEKNPKNFILRADSQSYGHTHKKFIHFVDDWCERVGVPHPGLYLKSSVFTDMTNDSLFKLPKEWTDLCDWPKGGAPNIYLKNPKEWTSYSFEDLAELELIHNVPSDANLNWYLGWMNAFFTAAIHKDFKFSQKLFDTLRALPLVDIKHGFKKHAPSNKYWMEILWYLVNNENWDNFDCVSIIRGSGQLNKEQFKWLSRYKGYSMQLLDNSRLSDEQLKSLSVFYPCNGADYQRMVEVGYRGEVRPKKIKSCKGFENSVLAFHGTPEKYRSTSGSNEQVFVELINYDIKHRPPLEIIDNLDLWSKTKQAVLRWFNIKEHRTDKAFDKAAHKMQRLANNRQINQIFDLSEWYYDPYEE
jgi:hypothetical protein